jgi:hypothetical protein
MRQELSAITVLRHLINDIVKSDWPEVVAQKAGTGAGFADNPAGYSDISGNTTYVSPLPHASHSPLPAQARHSAS